MVCFQRRLPSSTQLDQRDSQVQPEGSIFTYQIAQSDRQRDLSLCCSIEWTTYARRTADSFRHHSCRKG